ncbi:peptidylprolyl isomerase [Cystobacter fuscus]|uniref:peptidylprolyl isomerase n=1 Tax=Cystobacter fuscus TaxID=43 RepID=UPI002B2CD90C|nr:peptidyl-prolyl cis-trans isomerase [Cystobacter fuscus]
MRSLILFRERLLRRLFMPVWLSFALAWAACDEGHAVAEPEAQATGPIVARFTGGVISLEEMRREAQRLPPSLREQFESEAGQREFVLAMVDKRLMAREARRRGLAERPDIVRQVRELEERLVIQELLAEEERAAGAPSEAELRAYHEANKASFQRPERVHVARVLAAVAPGAGAAEKARARSRAEEFARRLRSGEPMSRVYSAGDGPERALQGDLGWWTRGERGDKRLEEAAFALSSPGQLSPVVETAEGFAVVQLLEREPGRTPSFEEVRSEVEGRLAPARQRKVFDGLRSRLRSASDVHVEVKTRP